MGFAATSRDEAGKGCAQAGAAAQLGLDPRAVADWLGGGTLADVVLAATGGFRPLIYADPGRAVDERIRDAVQWAEQEHRRITGELVKVEKQFRALRQELSGIVGGRHFWDATWQQHREDCDAASPKA